MILISILSLIISLCCIWACLSMYHQLEVFKATFYAKTYSDKSAVLNEIREVCIHKFPVEDELAKQILEGMSNRFNAVYIPSSEIETVGARIKTEGEYIDMLKGKYGEKRKTKVPPPPPTKFKKPSPEKRK